METNGVRPLEVGQHQPHQVRRDLLAARHGGGVLAGSGGHPARLVSGGWSRTRRCGAVDAAGRTPPSSSASTVFVAWFGIPTDRIGLAALATGFLSIGLLGKGWRAWGRMLLDWLPFQAVLLVYDYSRGFATPYSDEQMAARDYPTHDVHNALGLPLQVRAPIDFDQWLADLLTIGTTPTQWLQTHLHPGPVDGTAIPWFAVLVSRSTARTTWSRR